MTKASKPPVNVTDCDQVERVRRLAGYVKRAQEALHAAIDGRDGAILEANDAGHSQASIARAANLSPVTILRIITNRAAARGPGPLEGTPHGETT